MNTWEGGSSVGVMIPTGTGVGVPFSSSPTGSTISAIGPKRYQIYSYEHQRGSCIEVCHRQRSSRCWPTSTNPLEKLTNRQQPPRGVAVGASAAATDAEIEQLPGDEGPVVVPLEGAHGGVQVTGGSATYRVGGRR
jgi:hypothetical protein